MGGAADESEENTPYTYDEASKPFPSLTQCYKNNQNACCVSAHDYTIASAYTEILSSTCLREYEYLELYYCMGCYPHQGKYVGNTTGYGYVYPPDAKFTMRICKSFAMKLYDPDNSNGKYNYDNCGLIDSNGGYLP